MILLGINGKNGVLDILKSICLLLLLLKEYKKISDYVKIFILT